MVLRLCFAGLCNPRRRIQVRIGRLAGHDEIADLHLTPLELLGGDRAAEQLVDEPDAVGVQHVALAVAGNLLDLPSENHFLDAAAVNSLWLSGEPEYFAYLVQFHLGSGHVRAERVTEVERVVGIAMKILSYLQAASRNSVHHRSIPEHRQIEAVSVEGNKLRKQLSNLFDEIAYQFCLGSLANVRCAERVDVQPSD